MNLNQIDNLYIWNNGPTEVYEDFLFDHLKKKTHNISLINEISNYPLSFIYNWFIDKNQTDYFILFDDDSKIELSYMETIESLKYDKIADLILPRIKQNNEIHSPREKSQIVLVNSILNYKYCSSIGSGIIINKRLVKIFKKKFKTVFDERFCLYGVDTTFFIRLSKLNKEINVICQGELSHSLSRLDPNEKNNLFRFQERTLDLALCTRNYPNLVFTKLFIKRLIAMLIKYHNLKLLLKMLRCFINGIHPNCQNFNHLKYKN